MRRAAVLAALAAWLAPLGALQANGQAVPVTDVIATKQDRYDRMTVPVRIGGQGPFDFLVDTGSQNTVLASSLAAQLAIVATARATLVSMAGRQQVDTAEIEEMTLGKRSFTSLLVPLLERAHLGADGIVGLDSLQGQRVLIDFDKGTMAVDDARALGGNRGFDIVFTARRRSGQLIMTRASIDGVDTDVVIDTGAETSGGNRALQRALAHRLTTEQVVLHSVTGDRLTADLAWGRSLRIEGATITNVAIAYADALPFRLLELDARPALLLGMRELRVFRRVAIDFATRKILFDVPPGTR